MEKKDELMERELRKQNYERYRRVAVINIPL